MKVLNFGSLNVDYVYKLPHIVEAGETISSEKLALYPGGKGLNQSVALGKAGVEVYHAGAIGEDGRFLVDFLKNARVHTDFVKVLPEEKSGHAIIQNDAKGENCIILFGGANQAITRGMVDEVLQEFGKDDYLILQNEINELGYIVERAKEKGMVIVLNPSPMNEKILKLPLEYVDYFILNEIEAAQILRETKQDIDLKRQGHETARHLLEAFPRAGIILTLGGAGSVYMKDGICYEQSIYQVDVVDTTAAGDTFTGYFVAGMIQGRPMKEIMDTAARAAAITVSREGAGVAIPTREEVETYRFV